MEVLYARRSTVDTYIARVAGSASTRVTASACVDIPSFSRPFPAVFPALASDREDGVEDMRNRKANDRASIRLIMYMKNLSEQVRMSRR